MYTDRSDPYQRDDRTDHESLPVTSGVKFGVNYWIHMCARRSGGTCRGGEHLPREHEHGQGLRSLPCPDREQVPVQEEERDWMWQPSLHPKLVLSQREQTKKLVRKGSGVYGRLPFVPAPPASMDAGGCCMRAHTVSEMAHNETSASLPLRLVRLGLTHARACSLTHARCD